MASRFKPISPFCGILVAAFAVALILGAMLAVALRAEAGRGIGPAEWAAIKFTVLQASLSAIASVILAIPVARALARRRFPGRRILIALLGAPFILPAIVAVFGLLEVFGRTGWVNSGLSLLGLPPLHIYGLHGVVVAHVFFNMPLATRLILQGWQQVPGERFRMAAQLGIDGMAMARLIEIPMLIKVVPGTLAVVFAICMTSFAVALILGGGPRATTVELAIYQAFRFDFDLGRAAMLSAIQMALTIAAAGFALGLVRGDSFGTGLGRSLQRWDGAKPVSRILDGTWVALASFFLLLPISAIMASGLPALTEMPHEVWRSAVISIAVAVASAILLLGMALPMSLAIAAGRSGFLELAGLMGLAVSPLVIGTGLFIMIVQFANPLRLALPVTALVNALTVLPFALRILVPETREIIQGQGRLAMSLDMDGPAFLRLVHLPRIRAQIGFAAGLSMALSIGDLGVIALFADSETATLPLTMYRLMGAYRMESAAGAALLLLALSFGLFWIMDRGGRWHAEA
ncbi:MAG: thiamine/thiamine pyrophosphate ABC transporter permease ThiP [Roseovarius sp.]|nr:thiamine/thiamine pyrophosphate ABC transporter permease ThiP [Roseovarius sp.]